MKRSYHFNSITGPETHNKVSLVEQNAEPLGHRLINVSSTFRVLRSDLMELAEQIEAADTLAQASAINKLEIIADQMKFLKSQACKVVVELRQGLSLNHVACNFKKVPGQVYHLYQRPSGQKYFSMLSPEEWNCTMPHQYIGSYRLEHDLTWTPAEKIDSKKDIVKLINNVLSSDTVVQDESNGLMLMDSQ